MLRRCIFALTPRQYSHHLASLAAAEHLVPTPKRMRKLTQLAFQDEPASASTTDALVPQQQQHGTMAATSDDDMFVLDDAAAVASATASSSKEGSIHPAIAAADRRGRDDPEDALGVGIAEFKRLTGGVDPFTDLARDVSGNINFLPKDSVQFVADEFRRLRELEMERRRKILAELATPNPADYTFDGKLVPMPPLNFGQLAKESYKLAEEMLLAPEFRCVRQCTRNDYFFEISELYCELAFVGRANAGKSSLVNALLGQEGLARTSSVPGSTRTVNFYQSVSEADLQAFRRRSNPNKLVKLPGGGLQFTLVDVPGFGIDGMSDAWREDAIKLTDSYVGQRRSLNTLVMCVDAVAGVTPTDERYFEWMSNLHGVFWIVLTKCDAVPHSRVCTIMNYLYERITSINSAATARPQRDDHTASVVGDKQNARQSKRQRRDRYSKIYPMIVPVSAQTGANVDFLRAMLVETSGVLPANALRHLLQRKRGAMFAEAVAEEKARLADSEQARMAELGAVQRQLAVRKGLLLPGAAAPASANDGTDESSPLQLPAADDDIITRKQGKKLPSSQPQPSAAGVNEPRNHEHAEGAVLSFDLPHIVPVVGDDDAEYERGLRESMNLARPGFKLSATAGFRGAAAVNVAAPAKKDVWTDESSSISNPFALELQSKLAERPSSHRSSALATTAKPASALQQQRQRGVAVLIEEPDGSLVTAEHMRRREQQRERDQRELQTALRRMTRRERAAYMRNSGGTRVAGDDLVDHTQKQIEVGAAQSVRRADWTMRKAGHKDLSNASRLPTGSMPAGLWRQYGSANDGRVNAPAEEAHGKGAASRVLGW